MRKRWFEQGEEVQGMLVRATRGEGGRGVRMSCVRENVSGG